MTQVVLAYVPVLHEGYRRFLERHARGRRVFVIGPELHADYRPLAKDVRALDPADAAKALASLEIATSVAVLDALGAGRLAEEDGLAGAHRPRRSVSSISPGRTSASLGPSLSPRFMYICRMRSDVVTAAWRSMTWISPTTSCRRVSCSSV